MNKIEKLFLIIFKKVEHFFYYQRVVLYANDLGTDIDYESKTNMKLEVAKLEDVKRLYNDDSNQDIKTIDWELWEEKFSQGLWRGFVCKDGKSIVAQAFYSREEIFFKGTKWLFFSMPPDWAYGFKLFTRKDYRGKKIGQAISSFRINRAREEGIIRFIWAINSDNEVARGIQEKLGGYKIGSIVFLKCRFFNKVFFSPWLIKKGFVIKNQI